MARGKVNNDGFDELWKTYKKTKDDNIRNVLIETYLPLVRHISERVQATLPKSIDVEDLASAGIFGLMDAIDGYDLSRGVKFKTYCTTRIKGSILDELRAQDWVPRLVRLKAHKIDRAYTRLESGLGRRPTDVEMAKELKIDLEEFHQMLDEASPVTIYSLSERWDDDDDDKVMERINLIKDKDSSSPVDFLHQKDVFSLITRNLSKKERLIIIMYYYEGLTMKEIGEVLDLTESRVCQIHSNILGRLKEQLKKIRHKLYL